MRFLVHTSKRLRAIACYTATLAIGFLGCPMQSIVTLDAFAATDYRQGLSIAPGETNRPESRARSVPLECIPDLVEHLGVLDRGRHGPGLAVGDLLDGAAQDFPGAGFGQAADRDRELEGGDRAELVAHQRDDVFFDLRRALRDAGLQHQKAAGHLALDRVVD